MCVAEFLALSGLQTSPGRATSSFVSSMLSYSVYTGYNSLSVTAASSNDIVVINGVNESSIVVSLASQQVETITIQLQSSVYGCFSPNVYTISAQQST